MNWLLLPLGIATNAAASVLVKMAMIPPREFPSLSNPAALLNWPFWLGLILYGSAFLLYAAALAHFPLNVAHPILTSGAIATVAILSVLIFNEPFTGTKMAGVVLVAAGVILITGRGG
jgi:small multidrug resistance pump